MTDGFAQRMADRLERIVADDYLAELHELDVVQLREMRRECETEEHRVSYGRRILQGRIDVLRAEASRRSDDTSANVLERLPDVLADQGARPFDPARARPPATVDAADLGDDVDVEGPADVASLGDDELRALADRYAAQEATLSDLRRRLFDVIDRLQNEVAERYRSGRANVAELLTGD